MRMWMLPPEMMCTQHRVGEHGEIHKHDHNLRRGDKIDGRFEPFVAIELQSLQRRHDELAEYMNHKSPYTEPTDLDVKYPEHFGKVVDIAYNLDDLSSRCLECAELIDYALTHYPEEVCNYYDHQRDV